MQKAGLEILPSFSIKFPEYSVITPYSKFEYTLRGLKVSEEEALKSSLLLPNKFSEHLNDVLYSVMIKKPEEIKTKEDFLKKNTLKDRDALMFALYHVTYKDVHPYELTCSQCSEKNNVKINFLNSFSVTFWDQPELALSKEVMVKLEQAEQLTFVVGLPSLFEEQQMLNDLSAVSDKERQKKVALLPIKYILIDIASAKKQDKIVDRINIQRVYDDLPVSDRKLIDKALKDNFEKYGSTIKVISNCQKCRAEINTEIDLVNQFFRAMYE